MDKEYEEIIVKTFFNKSIQNRVLFELFSQKKRKEAISRVDSSAKNGLCEKYKIELQKPNSNYIEIFDLLKKNGAGDNCYVLSHCEDIDGKHLPLSYALEKAVGFGMPSIISCIPNKLAYLECEQGYGSPPRYILKKE
jgi:hypothetical protein